MSRPRTWRLALLLAALSMLGPFSVDMYLPAFAVIGHEFAASPLAVQQTLSAYLFGFAFMMLWHGALSDALGRRPVIIAGLALYAIGTLGCAIAGNIESLWLARVIQGLSAGAGVVVGRAIVRDHYHGADAQRVLSQITLVFSVAPAIAPVLGALILDAFGWRAMFWFLLALVLALLSWTARTLPESLPPSMRQTLRPRVLWRNYRSVLLRPEFLLLAFVPALNFCAFFVYIASAPVFVMQLLGLSSLGFAWLFLPMIAGIVAGATLSGRLAGRLSPLRTVRLGYVLMFAGAAVNLAICAWLPAGVPWNVLPITLFTAGSSLTMPSMNLLLLDLFPAFRGTVSSLQGFLQFSLSAVTAGSIAPLAARSLSTLATTMTLFTATGFGLWLIYQHRVRARTIEGTP